MIIGWKKSGREGWWMILDSGPEGERSVIGIYNSEKATVLYC